MKPKLNISPDLSLLLEFVTATDGIFASKGMGKSHLGQVMAEEMLELGQVIVAIDPTDAWYGLRSSPDGKSDGYPVTVFGGDHGDMKLEPDHAVMLAEAVVAERFSCVICTDGERYDVRRLKREWAARLAAGEKPRTASDRVREESIRQAEFEQRMRAKTLRGAPRVVHCNHKVPWLDCRICSKPRSKP